MTAMEQKALDILQMIVDRAARIEQMPSTELFVQKVPAALITSARAALGSIAIERQSANG